MSLAVDLQETFAVGVDAAAMEVVVVGKSHLVEGFNVLPAANRPVKYYNPLVDFRPDISVQVVKCWRKYW